MQVALINTFDFFVVFNVSLEANMVSKAALANCVACLTSPEFKSFSISSVESSSVFSRAFSLFNDVSRLTYNVDHFNMKIWKQIRLWFSLRRKARVSKNLNLSRTTLFKLSIGVFPFFVACLYVVARQVSSA